MHVCTFLKHATLSTLAGSAGRAGSTETEFLLWMGPHQRRRVETVLTSDLKWNTPFSWRIVSKPPPSTLGPQPACTVSSEQGVRAPFFRGWGLQGTAFPVGGPAMAQRPGHWGVDMATWQWIIQSEKAPSFTAHRLSPPQHGQATLPESTNEGLVRARTTIPQRLWWGWI